MKIINKDIPWIDLSIDINEICDTANKNSTDLPEEICVDINKISIVNNVDDFKIIFDHLSVKIITAIVFLICQLFSNSYHFLMCLFEKYEGDPLKRSVNNQLAAQTCHLIILHNVVCCTLWTWRIMIGPLNPVVAEFEGFIQSIFLVFLFLNTAEIAVIKALMICKWSVVTEMNDQFFGNFVRGGNMAFIICSQFVRYLLGAMHETFHFQLLTGFKIGQGIDYFWPIYLTSTLTITGIAFTIIIIKASVVLNSNFLSIERVRAPVFEYFQAQTSLSIRYW